MSLDRGREALDRGLRLGHAELAHDGDLDRIGRLARKLIVEQDEPLLRLEAIRQRRDARGAGLEPEHGYGRGE
jgi:hypothetical protein